MSVAQAMMVACTIGAPALLRGCLNMYGFRGTVALLAALSLNSVPAMASLQPVKWHMKKQKVRAIEMENGVRKSKDDLRRSIVEGEPLLEHSHTEDRLHRLQKLEVRSLNVSRKSLVSMGSIAMSVTSINDVGLMEEPESKEGIW